MESKKLTSTNILLEISLEDLHRNTIDWIQSIDFWRFELGFAQKLVDQVNARTRTVDDKKRIDHFQNLIIYYRSQLLPELEEDLVRHEGYLKQLIQDRVHYNDQMYRDVHKKFEDQVTSFDQNFRAFKRDLYHFSEQFL